MSYADLPDLFTRANGARVECAADWPRRRAELLNAVVEIEYGGLPPQPETTEAELLCRSANREKNVCFSSWRVHTGPRRSFSFILSTLAPLEGGPFPVLLHGDGCWRTASDEVCAEVLRRGMVLARFNRTELAPDVKEAGRSSSLYAVFPGLTFGALSAWAWGYHRCVDVLRTMSFVNADRIAITGHSRGGKTVLLAGATDERIAMTNPNNSGAGGAGCYRYPGEKSERLADLMRNFPFWFGPRMAEYVDREQELPFDQHALKAMIAPRVLLSTEALGDLWANPSGTYVTHRAALEVFKLLGAEENACIWYREGGHAHGMDDWRICLDVYDWRFGSGARPAGLNDCPFPEL